MTKFLAIACFIAALANVVVAFAMPFNAMTFVNLAVAVFCIWAGTIR